MKIIEIIEDEAPVTINEINEFMQAIKINLPVEYISHLLKYNGGHPMQDTYGLIEPIWKDIIKGGSADIAWFYNLYNGDTNNILKNYNIFKTRIPYDLLPIACGSGGDQVCLCVKGQNYGKVYFWDHNWEAEEGEEPDYSNVYLIANSFEDFINSLYSFDIKQDKNDNDIYIYKYDKYSLAFSTHVKKYGNLITDFFEQASSEVEEYIIEEFASTKNIILSYIVKSGNNKYQRIIDKNGKIIKEEVIKIL